MKYRREIDGLRAVAVIPVILFHAGFRGFDGGFVGVDVFFVISGYLITTILFQERGGGISSLIGFYERRARRILPALFTVLIATLPLAWVVLNPKDMQAFSLSLAAVAGFMSNILFWRTSGYFDVVAEKPLIHTWSLAVEEQYYLLFPVFLLMLGGLSRKWIALVFALILAGSLGLAQWGAVAHPVSTFYLLHTRAWELLIGALLALFLLDRAGGEQEPGYIDNLGGALGFALIVYAVCAFDRQTPFPSLYGLIPTVGAALIIAFATRETIVGKILGSKPLVGIGLVSYSAYLWHEPLFAFARKSTIEAPGKPGFLVLITASFLLAYLSWRFIEKPFRDRERVSRRGLAVFCITGSLVTAIIGFLGYHNDGWAERFKLPPAISASLESGFMQGRCEKNAGDGEGDFCLLGDLSAGAMTGMAVFGDSHTRTALSAFDEIGKQRKESVVYGYRFACPPLLGAGILNGSYKFGVCQEYAERQLAYVKSKNIRKVFLVSSWTLYTDGGYDGPDNMRYLGLSATDKKDRDISRSLFEEAFHRTVAAYREVGIDVYVVAQVPQQTQDAYELYYKLYSGCCGGGEAIRKVSVPRGRHEAFQSFTRDIFHRYASRGEIKLVILDDAFCDNSICYIGGQEGSFYTDFNHLSKLGAHMAAAQLLRSMEDAPDRNNKQVISGAF